MKFLRYRRFRLLLAGRFIKLASILPASLPGGLFYLLKSQVIPCFTEIPRFARDDNAGLLAHPAISWIVSRVSSPDAGPLGHGSLGRQDSLLDVGANFAPHHP
jgi:hypothetical protein